MGDKYEEAITSTSDIFNLQSEIAQKIAVKLGVSVTHEESQIIGIHSTSNLTALEFYQRGREELIKSWKTSNQKDVAEYANLAQIYFHKALLTFTFADAYAGLGFVAGDRNNNYYNWQKKITRTLHCFLAIRLFNIITGYQMVIY